MSEETKPLVLQLNPENSVQLLAKYVELGQSKGVFKNLKDVDLFKRAIDVLVHKAQDNELNVETCINILSQGVNMIQSTGGIFTINDASILYNILSYLSVSENLNALKETKPAQTEVLVGNTLVHETTEETKQTVEEIKEEDEKLSMETLASTLNVREEKSDKFDLSELSKPVSLKKVMKMV